MSDLTISMVKRATDTQTRDVPLHEVLRAIRTGGRSLLGQITQIRSRFQAELAKNGGDLKAARRAIESLKKALPAIMPCGVFRDREQPVADKLKKHSGLFTADFDDLGERLPGVRKALEKSLHVFAFFLSPSGNGLKVFFRVPADASKHAGSFRAVEKHVLELTGIRIDESGKDISRLCFMSYDPWLYVNEKVQEIAPLPEPEKAKPVASRSLERNSKPSKTHVREMLAVIPKRPHYNDWITLCAAVGDALPLSDALEVLKEWSEEEQPGEYAKKLASGFSEIHVGTLFHVAKQHGWKPAPKGEARSADDDEQIELTSLFSCAVAYPAPPDEAAFYGLAGDIVQRMAPHTEADPVALLVQFLVLFGNIIGRRAHAVADGAWHYFNLFCVLVGETSKGRKGTALHHMLQLFEHADEEAWRKNCLASGLSSGEGVIYAVRDEIKTTKPVKEKGKYTGKSIDVVTDSGVADKRLMVIESEFCSAIKVMTREGNILSATLRQAWDSGNLRILTKNSPVRATGAHISIIAHITRHEARHELTETESANGFGNRILWTAARRSKCLPEGGESYGVADLVVRLHKAIEFGRATGELQRSDEARKAWARVYPELSEGKPGLLGAITARAEAQVLRLSNLYALLDCLGTVEVDHLRAALALWAYCGRSAGWIFESGTGSRNADKILAALKAAGEKGLTKSEITSYVFNRNATKFEIEEALRLLVEFELAHRLAESTGGRRAERWFYKGARHEEYEESRSEESQQVVTSFSSPPQLSKNVSLAESDTDPSKPESKVVSGEVDATVEQSADLPASTGVPIEADEKGVGRL